MSHPFLSDQIKTLLNVYATLIFHLVLEMCLKKKQESITYCMYSVHYEELLVSQLIYLVDKTVGSTKVQMSAGKEGNTSTSVSQENVGIGCKL